MEQAKRPRGRPVVPPELRLLQGTVRLTQAQWTKIEEHGGLAWLRQVIDRSKLPPVR